MKSIVLIVYYSMFLCLEFVPPNYAQKWFTVYHTHIYQICKLFKEVMLID